MVFIYVPVRAHPQGSPFVRAAAKRLWYLLDPETHNLRVDLIESNVSGLWQRKLLCQSSWQTMGWSRTLCQQMLSVKSMETILAISLDATHEDILRQVCKAMDGDECRLHHRDKMLLSKVAVHGSIRYKLIGKISEAWQKAFLAIQIVLSKDDSIKLNYSLSRDCKNLVSLASRLIRGAVQVLSVKEASIALRSAVELEGAINGQAWHEGPAALCQIEGIGPSYAASLARAGIEDVYSLRETDAAKVEFVLKRNPPFGVQLLDRIRALPEMELSVHRGGESGEKGVTFRIKVQVRCIDQSIFYLLAIREKPELKVILKLAIQGTLSVSETITIEDWHRTKDLTVSLLCSSHGKGCLFGGLVDLLAGCNIHKVCVNEHYVSPKKTVPGDPLSRRYGLEGPFEKSISQSNKTRQSGAEYGLQIPSSIESEIVDAASIAKPPMNRAADASSLQIACSHKCRDKKQCAHVCCKDGVKRRRSCRVSQVAVSTADHRHPRQRGLVRWIDALRDRHDHPSIGSSSSSVEYVVTEGVGRTEALLNYIEGLNNNNY